MRHALTPILDVVRGFRNEVVGGEAFWIKHVLVIGTGSSNAFWRVVSRSGPVLASGAGDGITIIHATEASVATIVTAFVVGVGDERVGRL